MRNAAAIVRAIAASSVLLVAPASARVASADACASSEIQLAGHVTVTSTAATLDTSAAAYNAAEGSYDIPLGTIYVHHGGTLIGTYVASRDYYDVSGVAPGTVVTLNAEFDYAGTISTPGCGGSGCWGDFTASIAWNGQTAQDYKNVNVIADTWTSFPVSGGTSLPVTFIAGTPQLIEFKLQGFRDPGGNQIEDATGHIRFTGSDSSIQVVSCNGYGDRVTPTRASSWGSLKVRYR